MSDKEQKILQKIGQLPINYQFFKKKRVELKDAENLDTDKRIHIETLETSKLLVHHTFKPISKIINY